MYVRDLMIEVTRRCQFQCSHCLRGKAQNKTIDIKHIHSLIDQVSSIGTITFTGGEPSLNVKAIKETLIRCRQNNVDVGSFYIATNGAKITEEFVVACLQWYNYCIEKDSCSVNVSNDQFHAGEGMYDTELLDGLTFFSRKHSHESYYYEPIIEGLAEEHGYGGDRKVCIPEIELDDWGISEGEMYLNCNGYIINGCNWSYKSQNKNKLCHVDKFGKWFEDQLPTECDDDVPEEYQLDLSCA